MKRHSSTNTVIFMHKPSIKPNKSMSSQKLPKKLFLKDKEEETNTSGQNSIEIKSKFNFKYVSAKFCTKELGSFRNKNIPKRVRFKDILVEYIDINSHKQFLQANSHLIKDKQINSKQQEIYLKGEKSSSNKGCCKCNII